MPLLPISRQRGSSSRASRQPCGRGFGSLFCALRKGFRSSSSIATPRRLTMQDKHYAVTHTDDEWRRLLTPEQYRVMRGHGTEPPGSCALNYEKRSGAFACAGCDQKLFVSK